MALFCSKWSLILQYVVLLHMVVSEPKEQQERISSNSKEHSKLLLISHLSVCCYQSKSHGQGLSQGLDKEIPPFNGGKIAKYCDDYCNIPQLWTLSAHSFFCRFITLLSLHMNTDISWKEHVFVCFHFGKGLCLIHCCCLGTRSNVWNLIVTSQALVE